MTFDIKRIITKHVLTHGKDFALVELEFKGEPRKGFDEAAHRYGTIEWGTKSECLAGLATGATVAEALKNREDMEEVEALFDKFGRDPETFKNPEFVKAFKELTARA